MLTPEQKLYHWLNKYGPRPWASIASVAQYLGADMGEVPITWIAPSHSKAWGYSGGTPPEHQKWGLAAKGYIRIEKEDYYDSGGSAV